MKTVHIESDGTAIGTHLTIDGVAIEGVQAVRIEIDAAKPPTVTAEFSRWSMQFDGVTGFEVRHPVTGKRVPVKSITFEDGTAWEAATCSE